MAVIHAADESAVDLFSVAIIVAASCRCSSWRIEGISFRRWRKPMLMLDRALLATFTVSPALSALLCRGIERRRRLSCASSQAITPSCVLRSRKPGADACAGVLLVLLSVLAGRRLQLEFLPSSKKVSMDPRPCRSPSRSKREWLQSTDARRHQELSGSRHRGLQHGRPDDGTDTAGFYNANSTCR